MGTRAPRDPEGDVRTGNLAGGQGAGPELPPYVRGRVPARFPGDGEGRGPATEPGAQSPARPPRARAPEPTRRGMEAGAADALLSGACVVFTLGMFSTGL